MAQHQWNKFGEITKKPTGLFYRNEQITYQELDAVSNVIANLLRKKSVHRNDAVPVIGKRGWHSIAAILGIMKSGGAYLPISPDYPIGRIQDMITDSGAKIILTYDYEIAAKGCERIPLERIDYDDIANAHEVDNINTPDDICYILYTSGSTGKAKAVVIRHRNLINFLNLNEKNEYQRTFSELSHSILADTSFVFDISIFEILLSLLHGKTVVLTDDMASSQDISQLIETYHVDTLHTTPTKLKMWMSDPAFQKALRNLKLLMCGAEEFTEELFKRIRQYSDAVVYNGYGPTEITIGSSFKRIERA